MAAGADGASGYRACVGGEAGAGARSVTRVRCCRCSQVGDIGEALGDKGAEGKEDNNSGLYARCRLKVERKPLKSGKRHCVLK